MISSLTEHKRKIFKVEYLSQIAYDFQNSQVTGPWDHKDYKKENKKFMLVYF
jgi:hypothetical protein